MTRVMIGGRQYGYCDAVRDDALIRGSFNGLAVKTFGLSFENWYLAGYWRDSYIPHVLLDGDTVAANVSVNIINSEYGGRDMRFVQLGTVMTRAECRGRGLSKFLMETVMREWVDRCDGIYLYANDRVRAFYPRFGFKEAREYQYSMPLSGGLASAVKLDMESREDVALLLKLYRAGNPFSKLPVIGNEGLLMFYCAQFLKDNVFFCRELNAAVIAAFSGDTMSCYDIFGADAGGMIHILQAAAQKVTRRVYFGFTPKEQTGRMRVRVRREEDTTFFWHDAKPCIFDGDKLMFPLLSHA